jgi:outer membrane protein
VKFYSLALTALLALPAAAADATPPQAPSPVAIVRFQDAILTTQEGQRGAATLKAKFDPRKAQLEKRQAELVALQQKLEAGADTMSPADRAKMQESLARGSRDLKHDADDLNNEVKQDEGQIFRDIVIKMSSVIQTYATRNGFTLVLDVSSQESAIIWAAGGANISADIVKAYDEAHPVRAAAAR